MKTKPFKDSNEIRMLIGFAIVLGAIVIARTGFAFGDWLYQTIN